MRRQYLIPVKLLLGQLPSPSLLARFGLSSRYGPVAAAVRSGDARALAGALDAHQEHFIRAGTFLLLEKLRAGVYRTLFKRVHNIQKARDPPKAFQVPIALFEAALRACGVDMDADEVEVRASAFLCELERGVIARRRLMRENGRFCSVWALR